LLNIIIVNYNSTNHLLVCLRSIYNSLKGLSAEIFVQDNASQDNVDRVVDLFPDVNLTKNKSNLGFAKAVNQALKQSIVPYVLLINPDSHVKTGALKAMLSFMEANLDIAILGPKILNPDGSVQGSARSFPTLLTGLFGRTSLLTRFFPNNRFSIANIRTTLSDGISPIEVDWVSGACMMIRRSAINAVGNLDESFFMYWEDADWCRRMTLRGWKVIYFPKASITHHIGVSSNQLLWRTIWEFHKSSYLLFSKYAHSKFVFLKPFAIGGLGFRYLAIIALKLMSIANERILLPLFSSLKLLFPDKKAKIGHLSKDSNVMADSIAPEDKPVDAAIVKKSDIARLEIKDQSMNDQSRKDLMPV